MADKNDENVNTNNADTLYEQSLSCYVAKLNYNVYTLDSIPLLRYLPPRVMIDVYVKMSQFEELKDMLFEQLADLEIFERLLRFDLARQKLFRCLTALTSGHKPLPSQLQQNYTQRYQKSSPVGGGGETLRPTAGNNSGCSLMAAKLSTLARAKLNGGDGTPTGTAALARVATTAAAGSAVSETSPAAAAAPATTTTTTTTTTTMPSESAEVVATTETAEGEAPPVTGGAAGDNNSNAAGSDDIADKQHNHDDDAGDFDATVDADEDEEDSSLPAFTAEVIDFGLRLASFLAEGGWMAESGEILQCIAARLRRATRSLSTRSLLLVRLDCLQRLLLAQSALCKFKAAARTFDEIVNQLLPPLTTAAVPNTLLANTYTQFSAMYFARSEYDESHAWSVMAIRHLEAHTPERIAVDVLRQASKACVVKRDFQRANMLICQATRRARKVFGVRHQKYADTLLDYGFFLLNVDSVYQSVSVYKDALEIKRNIFGQRNFHVAIAHEELSYAYYVHEYSTGNFNCAREHVEKAVDIMKDLVPNDNLMLASAKRVKALLLEEIALDKISEGASDEGLLKQSEELHQFALQLSLEVFGEVNVQTAKHYGNLGRLYQTMNRFEEAERMHIKAIKIKTDLLGPFDYEVGLSVGHLASLYNYQMKKYRQAEELYLRSIEISLRLFGRSYSGLEYDYLGLCHVYEVLVEFEKYVQYATILENWQVLRGQNVTMNKSIYPAINDVCPLEDIKQRFFNM